MRSTLRPLTTVLVVGIALSTLVACGSAGSGSGSPSPSVRPTTPLVSQSDLVTPTEKGTPRVVTVTGRLVEAVEAGCTVLRADDGRTYTLTGAVDDVRAAVAPVTVRGRLDPDLVSHCQQGPVLIVTEVVPAG